MKSSIGPARRRKQLLFALIVLIAVFTLVWLVGRHAKGGKNLVLSSSSSVREGGLKATVMYWGAYFTLTNNDTFNWTDLRIEIKGSGFLVDPSGSTGKTEGHSFFYAGRDSIIEAGRTYKLTTAEFAEADGTRLSAFVIKPQSILITASTPHGPSKYEGRMKPGA